MLIEKIVGVTFSGIPKFTDLAGTDIDPVKNIPQKLFRARLTPEPTNPVDIKAVKVEVIDHGIWKHVGYIAAESPTKTTITEPTTCLAVCKGYSVASKKLNDSWSFILN